MKKNHLHLYACPLLFILIFIASCSGQSNSNTLESNHPELEVTPKNASQIAEYVVEIFEDKKGNLWFGTIAKGVARYDGKTLTYFSTKDGLCGNVVTSIAEDKEGTLWFGSHTGVCTFDGKTFTTLQSTTGMHDRGVGWMSVRSDKNGDIWVSSNKGVFRYVDSSFSEFNIPIVKAEISSYSITAGKASLKLEDNNGNLWFGTDGFGAFRFDGNKFVHFTKKDGLCSNNVTSILEDKQGRIWFTCIQSYQPEMTGDGGLSSYDGNTFTKYPEIEGLSKNDIYTIYEEKSGNIWIGATGVGVYRYDGKKFTLFKETDRMDLTHSFGLQGVLEDRNGTLWFGFSGGLFRFNDEAIVNVTQDGPWE